MRVALLIREGVMLAMDRDPLLRRQSRRQPQRELERPFNRRMQHERLVRGGAVQVNGRAEYRGLNEESGHAKREQNRRQQQTPPRKAGISLKGNPTSQAGDRRKQWIVARNKSHC